MSEPIERKLVHNYSQIGESHCLLIIPSLVKLCGYVLVIHPRSRLLIGEKSGSASRASSTILIKSFTIASL